MHIVGFIIRICHDARSPEPQINNRNFSVVNVRPFTSDYHRTDV